MDLERFKIISHDFPPEFALHKIVARDYFNQFGKVKRITFKQQPRTCTAEFTDQEGYLQALNNAGEHNGIAFTVTSLPVKMPKSEKLVKKKEPVWVDKDEIEAELAAMSGYAPKEYTIWEGSTIPLRDSSKFEKIPKIKKIWKSETPTKAKRVIKPKLKENVNVNLRISGEEVDLVNLVLSQAMTADDKYKILDARDKLIKLKLKKIPAVKTGPTVGTCPDMCPEKERLFREIKHQVAWYEQEDNYKFMNHNKAVKQYSRSSADQEAPLAHELRPVSVLQMTMGYLLHNIIDLCDTDEVHLGEWFHFLWDRTRGIRKDITQQELCSQGAVELVQQCARFHIHCSARLVAEDPSVFDQKINTENLTKCLQTLKYMYHDLLLKGESCDNEAEFRAYIILLNLNDANFMWEVQQLRPKIQRSKEVRFAIQVYSAVDKNNYVQFFKLVNSTTYLNACIIMRYFVQVRVMALKTLLKCYIPRAAKTVYPLSELQTILAFDDIDSTIDFLQYYGLSVNDECTHVILDKKNFSSPEFSYMLDRSMVVEDKRTFSVGKIICGKDLPPKIYLSHKIHNSFDTKGYLVNKDIIDELDLEKVKMKLLEELDESKEERTQPVMKEEKTSTNLFSFIDKETTSTDSFSFINKGKPSTDLFSFIDKEKNTNPFALTKKQSGSIFATKEVIPPTTQSIFASPQFTFQPSISEDQPDFASKNEDKFPEPIPDQPIFSEPIPIKGGFTFNLVQPNQIVPSPTRIELPQADIELEKKKTDEEIQRKIAEEKLKLIKQKELEEKQKILEAKLEEARKKKELRKKKQEEELQRKLEELQKEEEQLKQKEIKQTVKEVVNDLITKVDNNIRENTLAGIRESIKKRMLIKILKKWKFIVSKKKRKRKAIDYTPVWVNSKTLEESAEDLHTSSQELTLTLMKRYKYGKPLDIGVTLDEQIETINIYYLTYSILKNRMFELSINKPKSIFWKIVISLPDQNELDIGLNRMEETMSSAFPWKKYNKQMLYLDHVKPNITESVTYCIEKQQGYKVNSYDSNGIIFIAKNFNANLQRRIFENLKGFGVYTKVPIVIILQEYNYNECKLEKLIKENIVSDYVILVENASAVKLVSVVEEGLVFLAKKIESPPPLELDSIKSFLTKYLCSEIWKRANSFAKWNSAYKKCLQDPNIVLDLYNEGLNKLKAIVLNESNKEHTVFPEEFKKYLNSETPDYLPCSYRYFPTFWKNEAYINKLRDILMKLKLPRWEDIWPPLNEHELELSVFTYCSGITKEPKKLFYKVMSLLLRKVDPNINFVDIKKVLWTDVIEVLGLEKISDIINLPGEFNCIYKEYFVIYDINNLNDYRFCDWFYVYNPKIKKCVEEEFKQPIKEKTKICNIDFELTDDFINSIRIRYLSGESDKSDMLKEVCKLNKSLQDLNDSMAVHKKISTKLDESLSRAIAEK